MSGLLCLLIIDFSLSSEFAQLAEESQVAAVSEQ